ncbi:MAG: SDR family NAD(P)-dependent oxidoreductase [Bifidobacteriaceae bacterium]|jgi:short-subunit dehydrogenase|nr:SDR family NAD(P)-dependent oxidoreductase [Bifidobacteriaceae bacterium]
MGTALITGASAGLGEEFAWQLATLRHNLVLVARDEARLEQLAGKLRSAAGVRVEVLPADLAKERDLNRVAARLKAPSRPVGLLVNNAGFGFRETFLEAPLKDLVAMEKVMIHAVLVLSHTGARAMIERGRGAILNVSSIAAHFASGSYAADKAWVKTFTEGLAVELKGTGVTATALLPGLTRTEFHARAGLDYLSYPSLAWLSASDVVAQALTDVRHGIVLSTPSVRYAVLGQIARLLPRFAVRALSRIEDR